MKHSIRGIPTTTGLGEAGTARGWTAVAESPLTPPWPAAEQRNVLASWQHDGVPITLVEDRQIARTYLWSTGPRASELFHGLVQDGLLSPPEPLLEAARNSRPYWADLGDTLYDLIAGCIDPGLPGVVEEWLARLHDEHPLVRLAAAWTAPYLASEDIAEALDAVAASDPEPDVKSAAAESAAALRT